MQIENTDMTRGAEVVNALIKALKIAVSDANISDATRDAIVTELEAAMTSNGQKAFATHNDSRMMDVLENMILALRVQGASQGQRPHMGARRT